MYKEASMLKLRVQTQRGLLAAEQLWDLDKNELDSLAVQLEEEYKKSGKKSYLVKKSVKDRLLKLRFDIVLDILTTKVEREESDLSDLERKQHNEKIDSIIARKQEQELENLSIKELEKRRK